MTVILLMYYINNIYLLLLSLCIQNAAQIKEIYQTFFNNILKYCLHMLLLKCAFVYRNRRPRSKKKTDVASIRQSTSKEEFSVGLNVSHIKCYRNGGSPRSQLSTLITLFDLQATRHPISLILHASLWHSPNAKNLAANFQERNSGELPKALNASDAV